MNIQSAAVEGESTTLRVDDEEEVVSFSIGFLTALVSDELVPCETILAESGWEEVLPVKPKYELANIRRWKKEVDGRIIQAFTGSIGKMGQAYSAIETTAFMARCEPDVIILCGIAGSLVDWIKKKDVVVATDMLWLYQTGITGGVKCAKCGLSHEVYREETATPFPLNGDDRGFLQRHVSSQFSVDGDVEREFSVTAGKIFTWDYVIDGQTVVDRVLKAAPSSLCVEMEGGGFLASISRFKEVRDHRTLKAFIVRGISDYANKKDWDRSTRITASRNASSVAVSLGEAMASRESLAQISTRVANKLG